MTNHYKILGLRAEATQEDIKEAFRTLAQKYHPDRATGSDAAEKFKEINLAYQVLRDPQKRALHDRELKGEIPKTPKNNPYAGYQQPASAQENQYKDPSYYNNPQARQNINPLRPKKNLPQWVRDVLSSAKLFTSAVFGAALGGSMAVGHQVILGLSNFFPLPSFALALISGAFAALTIPMEGKLQLKLKEKYRDGYLLVRSVMGALAGAYFGALVGDVVAFQFGLDTDISIRTGLLLGAIAFAWITNEEAFWAKIRIRQAYFELFFVLVRALSIALLFALLGLFLVLVLQGFGREIELFAAAYYAFVIGIIFGSMTPSDLLAYSRYASAYAGKSIVLLYILLALVVGFALGGWARIPLEEFLEIYLQ